jgi:hypothetical protein
MRRLLFTLVMAFLFSSSLAIAAEFSSVEEQMTASEFKNAGLDKLSPEELAALNAWIKNRHPASGQVYDRSVDDKVRVGFEDSSSREVITSNLIGEFAGWRGGTTFKLENGQVWEQAEAGELAGIKPMSNPKVTIRPALIGSSWKLQVEGYNSTVRVRRVK